MRKKKIIDLAVIITTEIIKIPLTLIPLILFALGLIKITTEWRSILGPIVGINYHDPNANSVNILIGLALIMFGVTVFTLLVQIKAILQGWITASILFLAIFLLFIILIATPLLDPIAARIYFTKGSCEFYVEIYADELIGKNLNELCSQGKRVYR